MIKLNNTKKYIYNLVLIAFYLGCHNIDTKNCFSCLGKKTKRTQENEPYNPEEKTDIEETNNNNNFKDIGYLSSSDDKLETKNLIPSKNSTPQNHNNDSNKKIEIFRRDIIALNNEYKYLNKINCSVVVRKNDIIPISQLTSTLTNFDRYVDSILTYIDKTLKREYSKIFENHDSIKVFLRNWELVKEIIKTKDKSKISLFYKYPDKNIEDFLSNAWEKLCKDIETNMTTCQNENNLDNVANLLKILTELKNINNLEDEKSEQNINFDFYATYKKCHNLYYKNIKTQKGNIEKYLANRDSKNLAKELNKLIKEYDSKNNINSKNELIDSISEFIVDLLGRIKFDIKGAYNIAKNDIFLKYRKDFNFLKNLKKITKILINPKDINDEEIKLYKVLNNYLQRIYSNIIYNITIDNIEDAMEEITEFQKILRFLEQYDLEHKIKKLNEFRNIDNILYSSIDEKTKKSNKEDHPLDKNFFNQIKEAAKKDKKLKHHEVAIKSSNKQRLLNGKAKIMNSNSLIEDKLEQLQELVDNAKYEAIDEELEKEFIFNIENTTKNLLTSNNHQKKKLEQKLNKDNSTKILTREFSNCNSREQRKLIIKKVIDKIKNIQKNIQKNIENTNDLYSCRKDILNLLSLTKAFNKEINTNEEKCDNDFLESLVEDKINLFRKNKRFICDMKKGIIILNKNDIAKQILSITLNFSIYATILEISKIKIHENYDISKEIKSIFPNDIEKLLIEFIDNIEEIYNNNLAEFKKSTKNYDVKNIKNLLAYGENLEPLFLSLKKIYNEYNLQILQNICSLFNKHGFLEERKIYIKKFIENIETNITIISQDFDGINAYNDYCDNIKKDLDFIEKLSEEKEIDSSIYDNCLKKIKKEIELITEENEKLLKDLKNKNFTKYNQNINKLKAIQRLKIDEISKLALKNVDKTDKNILNNIDKLKKDAFKNKDKIHENIIQIKKISNNMPSLKSKADKKIDEILNDFNKKNDDPNALYKLKIKLESNEENNHIVGSILMDHKIFQGYKNIAWNDRTFKQNKKFVINELKKNKNNNEDEKKIEELGCTFDKYNEIYENIFNDFLVDKIKIKNLIHQVSTIIYDTNGKYNKKFKEKLPALLANIFAAWTFLDHASAINTKFLRKPHPAQIISILQMLGVNSSSRNLFNNLIQIRTGEGKSVTLAVMAIILALLDYEVNVVCYSSHLSERDYKAFEKLFNSFKVNNLINYFVFTDLCENELNKECDIRNRVINLLNNKMLLKKKSYKEKKKIILIDEVDVFFDLYGKTYLPIASLKNDDFKSIIDLIWKERRNNLTLSNLRKTDAYERIKKKFSSWISLFENIFSVMIKDSRECVNHKYYFNELTNKIGYKEHDSISYNITYGYNTLFSYFLEYEKNLNNKQLKKILDSYKTLNINCGSFLYSEIPKNFDHIMGVTGTLNTLTKYEKKTIADLYNIKKFMYMPSVFGENNLNFKKNSDFIKLCNKDDYYNDILKEILSRQSNSKNIKLPILVFFETKTKLDNFYNNAKIISQKANLGIQILHEGLNSAERAARIRQTTNESQITFATPSFARGIDYVVLNEIINNNGGLHVLSTYFSQVQSEEVQMKGRTARQGANGSFSMVIYEDELEKFGFPQEEIKDLKNDKNLYETLDEKRTKFFIKNYKQKLNQTEVTKEEHTNSVNFFKNLKTMSNAKVWINKNDNSTIKRDIKKFLLTQNIGYPDATPQKTICIIDGTYSMQHLLDKTKDTISKVFQDAYEELNGIPFEMKFVFYRNYGCDKDTILEASPWSTDHKILKKFLDNIYVAGGWGNEAIEIGLNYASKEKDLKQVILIGDMPPNTEEEVKRKREHFGEEYWQDTPFASVQHYSKELKYFEKNNIKVHTYYLTPTAKETFEIISMHTKGYSKSLDITWPDSAAKSIIPQITSCLIEQARGKKAVDNYLLRKGYVKNK